MNVQKTSKIVFRESEMRMLFTRIGVKYFVKVIALCLMVSLFQNNSLKAQGAWTPVNTLAPDTCSGVMLLLSDGSVIAKVYVGGGDSVGLAWNRLTPDIHGSYVNGTWSTIAPMYNTRLYFSSQVLKDGRVFVAGGEYGSGTDSAEVYNPLTNNWTRTPNANAHFVDANSEILPDGKVLEGLLSGGDTTSIYNPYTNTWEPGAKCHGSHDESAWVKLPDNSVLYVDIGTTHSERYIPKYNKWIVDDSLPMPVYDTFGYETGPGFLLPDGRAFFLGSTGNTVYYTPSGDTTNGVWTAGPVIPSAYGTPDAAGAMMVNGKILCAVSPVPDSNNVFHSPTIFFEFDYTTNTFTLTGAPGSTNDTLYEPCYYTNMLDLPDGTVLFASQGSPQYYVYTPEGAPLAAGKPIIDGVISSTCDTIIITGKLFNGISEGAAYGDDWQMATNYPVIRLSAGGEVYYARTFNWNRTGVQTGTMPDTVMFTLPLTIPQGTYSLVVTANGISSNPMSYYACSHLGIEDINNFDNTFTVYPNPADELVTVAFTLKEGGNYKLSIVDVLGRTVSNEAIEAIKGDNAHQINIAGINKGVYMLMLQKDDVLLKTKLIIE